MVQGVENSSVVLLHVDNHDAAYAWARRYRCEVNPSSGTLQIFEAQIETESVSEAPQEAGPLARLRDRQLRHLGIPETLIPVARSVRKETEWDQVKD